MTHESLAPLNLNQNKRSIAQPVVSTVWLPLFIIFLAAQFFSLTRDFFIVNFSENFQAWATIASYSSLVLLPLILLDYSKQTGSIWGYLNKSSRIIFELLTISIIILSLYGRLQGYSYEAIAKDMSVYIVLVSGAVLGSIPNIWKKIIPILLFFTLGAIFINMIGLLNIADLITNSYTARIVRDIQAYETRTALEFWPIILLLSVLFSRRFVYLSLGISVFVLILQILFQKRLFVTETLIYLGLFLVIIPHYQSRWNLATLAPIKTLRTTFIMITLLAGVTLFILLPSIFTGQLTGLLNRFGQQDDTRVMEALGMLNDFNELEYFIGRGMGGYYEYVDENNQIWGTYLSDVDIIGRRGIHIGVFLPMLKGGLWLSAIYYLLFVVAWIRRRYMLNDLLTFVAFSIVGIKLLFSLQGNYLGLNIIYEMLLFSLCLGRIMSTAIRHPIQLNNT